MAYQGAGEANGLCPNRNAGELHRSVEVASAVNRFTGAAPFLTPSGIRVAEASSEAMSYGEVRGNGLKHLMALNIASTAEQHDRLRVSAPITTRSGTQHHWLQQRAPALRRGHMLATFGAPSAQAKRGTQRQLSAASVDAFNAVIKPLLPTATERECTPAPRPRTSGRVHPTSGSHARTGYTERGHCDAAAFRDLGSASGASTSVEQVFDSGRCKCGIEQAACGACGMGYAQREQARLEAPPRTGISVAQRSAERARMNKIANAKFGDRNFKEPRDGTSEILDEPEGGRIVSIDGKPHICQMQAGIEIFVPMKSSVTSYNVFTPSAASVENASNSSVEPLDGAHAKPEVHISDLPKYPVGSPGVIIPNRTGASQAAAERPTKVTSGKLSVQESDDLLGVGRAQVTTENSQDVHHPVLLEVHAATDASAVVHRSTIPTPESVSTANAIFAEAPEDPMLHPPTTPPGLTLEITGTKVPLVAADAYDGCAEQLVTTTLGALDTSSADSSPAVLPSAVQRSGSWVRPTGAGTPVGPEEEPDAETASQSSGAQTWLDVQPRSKHNFAFEDTNAKESDTSMSVEYQHVAEADLGTRDTSP